MNDVKAKLEELVALMNDPETTVTAKELKEKLVKAVVHVFLYHD